MSHWDHLLSGLTPSRIAPRRADYSLGLSTNTCFMSSLFLFLKMKNASYTSSLDFSTWSLKITLSFESGLVWVRCLPRGLDLTQRKDKQTICRSNVLFTTMAAEKTWTSRLEKVDAGSSCKELVFVRAPWKSRAWCKNVSSQDLLRVMSFRKTL